MAKDSPGATPFPMTRALDIPQAWHRANHKVTYYIRGTGTGESLFPGTRVPEAVATEFANYENAASAWNIISAGVTLSRAMLGPETADVVIVGYWDPFAHDPRDPLYVITPLEDDGVCGASVACVKQIRNGVATNSAYPHLGQQTFFIENPPRWGTGPSETWTTVLSDAVKDREELEYLPWVLMHEFGHTFGLGHSSPEDASGTPVKDIMNEHGALLSTLSNDDEGGGKAIYNYHVRDHGVTP